MAAVEAAEPGDDVLLAPGDYAQPMSITKEIAVHGAIGTRPRLLPDGEALFMTAGVLRGVEVVQTAPASFAVEMQGGSLDRAIVRAPQDESLALDLSGTAMVTNTAALAPATAARRSRCTTPRPA